jgi:hypothetical protein
MKRWRPVFWRFTNHHFNPQWFGAGAQQRLRAPQGRRREAAKALLSCSIKACRRSWAAAAAVIQVKREALAICTPVEGR